MKTILFVSHSAELNGAELWLLETLARLDRERFRPSLICPRPGPLAERASGLGVETRTVPLKWWLTERRHIWRQPAASLWNARAVRRIAAIARAGRADAVFSNSAAMSAGAKAARKAGVPHVWAIHEILGGRRPFLHYLFGRRALARFIVRNSARVIVNSEATRAAFPASEKIALVPNGLDITPGDPDRQRALCAELGLGEADLIAGVVGKIYAGKGQGEALRAASLLAAKYPRLKWLVVGAVGDERYARRLRAFVAAAGLGERVLFTGYRPHLADLLRLMSVVVIPSVVESFGRVALEAMAAGVPVLAVRAGGLPEIVTHGENGFLVDSRQPAEIALGLEFILQNPDKAKATAAAGLRTVRDRFTVERQVAGVERVLDEVLRA